MAQILRCVVLMLMLLGASAADLYKVLGVDKNAKPHEIKKAFHKQSLKYHPDKNKSKNAQAKFSEISNAYEVLSDEEKRKQYDLTGDPTGQPRFEGGNPGGGFPGGQGGGGFPGGFSGGQSGGQRQNVYYTFQGPGGQQYQSGQDFRGWSDFGQFFTQQQRKGAPRKEEAPRDSGWGGFGFPSFGNGASSPGGFTGDIFSNLFGAAKKSFQDSFGGSQGDQDSRKQDGTQSSKLVQQLDSAQFQAKVERQEREMWVVLFYNFLDEKITIVNQVAEDLLGVVKVGAVNCQLHEKLCREQIPSTQRNGAANLVIYPYKRNGKLSHTLYAGSWTQKAVRDFCNKQIPNLSTRLDSQKLISLGAKLTDLPKAVLLTKTKETSAKWRALSCVFEKRIQFYDVHVDGSMDPTVTQQFGIKAYPAVVGLFGNGEDFLLASEKAFAQSGSKMMEELKKFFEELETKSKAAGVGNTGVDSEGDVPVLTKANAAVVCGSSSPLCVIAAVDLKKGGEKARQILSELSLKTLTRTRTGDSIGEKKPSVTFSLLDVTQQPSFVRAFTTGKVKGQDILLIAYKRRRGRFVLHKGPVTLQAAEEFVLAALGGDLTFQTVTEDPVLR
ncbi:unnamed protein product [Calypogeia fissa]